MGKIVNEIGQIIAESNSSTTVLNTNISDDSIGIVGNTVTEVKPLSLPENKSGLLHLSSNTTEILNFVPNKKLGTDTAGNLVWL